MLAAANAAIRAFTAAFLSTGLVGFDLGNAIFLFSDFFSAVFLANADILSLTNFFLAISFVGLPVAIDNLSTGWSNAVKFGPLEKVDLLEGKTGKNVFPISSVTNKGLEEILNTVLNVIEEKKIKEDTKKWSP